MSKSRSAMLCRTGVAVFAALYALALLAFFAGTFGLWGAERDPLAGIFLIPLGIPWNLLTGVFAEPLMPWLAATAPLLNLGLIWALCRRFNG